MKNRIVQQKWTKEEKALLWSMKTNEEIAKELNRTVTAVERARYYYTGHVCEIENAKARFSQESQIAKEARIINLCHQLGVRLQGVR